MRTWKRTYYDTEEWAFKQGPRPMGQQLTMFHQCVMHEKHGGEHWIVQSYSWKCSLVPGILGGRKRNGGRRRRRGGHVSIEWQVLMKKVHLVSPTLIRLVHFALTVLLGVWQTSRWVLRSWSTSNEAIKRSILTCRSRVVTWLCHNFSPVPSCPPLLYGW